MSERNRLLAVALSGAVALIYVGVLLYISVPGFRERVRRGQEWAAWYAWRARWDGMPGWMQEALQVRGKGPVT